VLTISPLPGLKIRLEISSIFSVPGQLRAQNVPAQAVIVDNSSPEITYHTSSWEHDFDRLDYYYNGMLFTGAAGSNLSYSFNGVAIWYDYLSHIIQ